MGPLCRRPPQRPQAVLVDGRLLLRHARKIEDFVLVRRQRSHLHERHDLVEDACVAGDPHIVIDDERQPCEVVGEARANAASVGRVPPVLHVALDELS